MAAQTEFQVAAHVRPFGGKDAIQDAVADAAIAARGMMTQDTVPLRPQRFDRPLRAEIEVVGPQPHDLTA